MSETQARIPETVGFADLDPLHILPLPGAVLEHYVPQDSVVLHAEVDNIILNAPVATLLEAEPRLSKLAWWDDPAYLRDHQTELADWRTGLVKNSERFELLGKYVQGQAPGLEEAYAQYRLQTAYIAFQDVLDTVAKAGKWQPQAIEDAKRTLAAELVIPDRIDNWLWWSNITQKHQQRKIGFVNDVLEG